ncbi:MAG TPA: Gfo/Idh/MocA family oxidoreductase [Roseiflexaceae bacterium]|nr:Gfo/Idh/MocA family oxidoreductase [Roseiflexaceae bacterium]HMP40617.1 Gfo/Idh/MocA family oxidoreductase [Roseiflexaceae bacterium]
MVRKIRAGIAGFDHFFASLAAYQELKADPNVEIAILAHHEAARLAPLAAETGALVTTDYRAVAEADIDLLITGCPTVQNPDLLIAGARSGKQLLSVKPFAMSLAAADTVVAAVEAAGVQCMSFDATWRFHPLYQHTRAALNDGSIGRPLSAYCMMRATLPDFVWYGNPFEHGRSWWLDPQQAPGGGWLDHAIYFVDALRWAMGSEVVRVSGEIGNLRHRDEAHEDFGVATMVFANGSIATIEVTWHVERPGFALAFELVGSDGELASQSRIEGAPPEATSVTTNRQLSYAAPGWRDLELPQPAGQLTTHMLAVMRGEAEPVATIADARANLAACLAFYTAAREHRSVGL